MGPKIDFGRLLGLLFWHFLLQTFFVIFAMFFRCPKPEKSLFFLRKINNFKDLHYLHFIAK